MGRFLGRLLGFSVLLILAATFWTIPLHEGFHWILLKDMGGTPVFNVDIVLKIIPISGNVGFAPGSYIPQDSSWFWFFYAGAGILTGAFIGFPLWFFAKWTPEKGDFWVGTLGLSIFLVQSLYGMVELLLYLGNITFSELYLRMGDVPLPEFLSDGIGSIKVYSVVSVLSTAIAMVLVYAFRHKGMWRWLMTGQTPPKRQLPKGLKGKKN